MTEAALKIAVEEAKSQSAFVRGFIDDNILGISAGGYSMRSQSAFVRGFIDDLISKPHMRVRGNWRLNPRSCAASSMT